MKSSSSAISDHWNIKFFTSFISGGMAGLIAKTLVAPLDRIKIIFQVTNEKFTFRNTPKILWYVVEKEGFFSLWKGNSAMVLRIAPYAALQFMTYEQMKAWFIRKSGTDNSKSGSYYDMISELMVCGGVAGAVSSSVTYPLDLARSRLAVELNSQKSATKLEKNLSLRVFSLIYHWFKTSGIRGLYSGLTPTILGIIPYGAISFTTNEVTKRMVKEFTERDLKVWEKLLCGAIAGASAQTIVYPLEMVRRRMQTVGHVDRNAYLTQMNQNSASTPTSAPRLSAEPVLSMTDVFKQIYHKEGIRGFYKGVTLNWVKGPITVGISFTAYDMFKKLGDEFFES